MGRRFFAALRMTALSSWSTSSPWTRPLAQARQRRPETGRSAPSAVDLSPDPLLAAVESFGGRWIDLDRSVVVGPDSFAHGRQDLAQQMRWLGLRPGNRVILAVGNGPLFPAALAAVLAGGGSPLLLHVETPPAESETHGHALWRAVHGL